MFQGEYMKPIVSVAAACALYIVSMSARAGLYTDDLARCLVEKTSKEDRMSLVRWMFSAAAANPAVASIAKVTAAQQDEANKAMADLTMKLLTESCREKAQQALRYEGSATLQTSFQVLGQVAGSEMYQSPEVAKVIGGIDKFMDKKRLEDLTK